MTRLGSLVVVLLVLAVPVISFAQDPLEENLIPPEVIMRYQRAIHLTDDQKRTITQAIRELQGSIVEEEWKLAEVSQELAELLNTKPIDEGEALKQMEVLIAMEREIKIAYLMLLIKIKNTLSNKQLEELKVLWFNEEKEGEQ